MREGFYRLEFLGEAGLGIGILTLDTEVVVGADTEGGIYDGEYVWNEQTQQLHVDVSVSVPEGTQTVQGRIAPKGGLKFGARCSFPRQPDNHRVDVDTDLGPVKASICFLRDFP